MREVCCMFCVSKCRLTHRDADDRQIIFCCFSDQAVENGFASFHLYVCAAFLKQFSKDIVEETDFQVCFRFFHICLLVGN